jgi:hypothetical protein
MPSPADASNHIETAAVRIAPPLQSGGVVLACLLDMLKTLRSTWGKWRAGRREYAIERALYKAGRAPDGRPKDGIDPHGDHGPIINPP